MPHIPTFHRTGHSEICADGHTYPVCIAPSILEYVPSATHTHQLLRRVSSECAQHSAHIQSFCTLNTHNVCSTSHIFTTSSDRYLPPMHCTLHVFRNAQYCEIWVCAAHRMYSILSRREQVVGCAYSGVTHVR